MNLRCFSPHLALIGLLSAASLALTFTAGVKQLYDPDITLDLPAQVGEWKGQNLFYCQNEQCMRGYTLDQLENARSCPSCKGVLRQTWSLAESRLLPADAMLLKKHYVHPLGQQITVSVVVSGKEQVTIHRPEVCLTGQGFEILRSKRIHVDNAIRPLEVAVLDLVRRSRLADGQMAERESFFAYWFVGKGLETASHARRMFRSGVERVILGKPVRWAYIGLAGPKTGKQEEELRDFIRAFYPLIRKEQTP